MQAGSLVAVAVVEGHLLRAARLLLAVPEVLASSSCGVTDARSVDGKSNQVHFWQRYV